MMDQEAQLRLQAFLDGELSESEAKDVARWLAQDQGAVALLAELRHTRQALAGFEKAVRLPESREFYWSKIERQIGNAPAPKTADPVSLGGFHAWVRRLFNPVAAAALLALVVTFAMLNRGGSLTGPGEATVSDPGAMTYIDYNSGTTLVWLSYPASSDYE